jgi:hypothetical protein
MGHLRKVSLTPENTTWASKLSKQFDECRKKIDYLCSNGDTPSSIGHTEKAGSGESLNKGQKKKITPAVQHEYCFYCISV